MSDIKVQSKPFFRPQFMTGMNKRHRFSFAAYRGTDSSIRICYLSILQSQRMCQCVRELGVHMQLDVQEVRLARVGGCKGGPQPHQPCLQLVQSTFRQSLL